MCGNSSYPYDYGNVDAIIGEPFQYVAPSQSAGAVKFIVDL